MSKSPVLCGEKVNLRPIGVDDAPAMLAALLDPDVAYWTGNLETYTLEQVKAHCARVSKDEGRLDYAITTKGDPGYIGEAVLQDIDWAHKSAHFRVALASSKWFGKGFGGEATRLLLAHGFETLGLNRIELEVYEFNARARALYAKLGFVDEGVRRQVFLRDGSFHNACLMSILSEEYVG